jgi:6-phosphogluconolactonase
LWSAFAITYLVRTTNEINQSKGYMKLKFLAVALAMASAFSVRAGHDLFDRGNDFFGRQIVGGVFTMDNSASGNHVWAFGRRANGSLTTPRRYSTRGKGSSDGLGNQGGVLLSRDGKWLFACNAGSHEISVFLVSPLGLFLTDKVDAQGQRPISLTLHRNLLFVLNAGGAIGGADNVAGFLLYHGRLLPLPNATHALSAAATGPAQIAFTRDGDHLVVTEKDTALIDTFAVDSDGVLSDFKTFTSPQPPPFGFAAGMGSRIFVTQANGGAGNPGASSVSSYTVTDEGDLEVISDSIPSFQTAACWLLLTRNEQYAFTANTPSDSISSYAVACDGTVSLLQSVAAPTGTGSGPVDMALSHDNRFLYSLNSGNGTIGSFSLDAQTGELNPLPGGDTVPATANGLAAR